MTDLHTVKRPTPKPHIRLYKNICKYTKVYICEARYDAEEPNELTVVPGDRVKVLRRNDETGWWLCISRRGKGWAPAGFLAEET